MTQAHYSYDTVRFGQSDFNSILPHGYKMSHVELRPNHTYISRIMTSIFSMWDVCTTTYSVHPLSLSGCSLDPTPSNRGDKSITYSPTGKQIMSYPHYNFSFVLYIFFQGMCAWSFYTICDFWVTMKCKLLVSSWLSSIWAFCSMRVSSQNLI